MLRWICRLLYVAAWGRPVVPEQSMELKVGSNLTERWTFGNVLVRVFLNHSATGRPYFKLQFDRLVGPKGGERLAKSFFVEDLDDVVRAINRVRIWLHDSRANS